MPKEIISKQPVSFPEVTSIFNKRKKDGELNYLQRIAHEHAQKSSKISGKAARTIIKELITNFDVPEAIAIHIINFMPETIEELRIFLQETTRVYTTEELKEILIKLKE